MTLPGWSASVDVPLPPGWSWKEDEDCVYLCSPDRVEAYFSSKTGTAILSETAALLCRQAEEVRKQL